MLAIPKRVADLPLPERCPRQLLHLTESRDRPDTEFDGFGWGWLDEIVLRDSSGHEVPLVSPLVVAVHSADDPTPGAEELELQFELRGCRQDPAEPEPESVSVIVPLPVFVRERLAPLLARNPAADVVLAMCNPESRALELTLPPGAGRVWWARGDVDSWLHRDDGELDRYVLTADRWTASEATS